MRIDDLGGNTPIFGKHPYTYMSNEKHPGCLGYIGDKILLSYIGIIINHEMRIPINQPGFNGK